MVLRVVRNDEARVRFPVSPHFNFGKRKFLHMDSKELNSRETQERLVRRATDPGQYDSLSLDWKKEGMLDSPTRQFFHEYLEASLENLSGKSVLDVGSGTGHLSKLFSKLGATEIYGIEPAHKNVEISRKLYPEMTVTEQAFEEARPERTFDVVTVVMAFEHMRDLDPAFQELSQFVKPSGSLYIIVGDKEYHTTERFGYELEVEDLGHGEVATSTKRPYGTMHDIFRPISNFIDAAQRAGFVLKKQVALVPTEKFIKAEPKYKRFEGKPLNHLLVFELSSH